MTVFEKLKEIIGSDENIAELFGMKRQAVLYWKQNGIPTDRALEVEKKTNGKITAMEVLEDALPD